MADKFIKIKQSDSGRSLMGETLPNRGIAVSGGSEYPPVSPEDLKVLEQQVVEDTDTPMVDTPWHKATVHNLDVSADERAAKELFQALQEEQEREDNASLWEVIKSAIKGQ